jgi:pimeloyl-ACP methyl ester carboxylesterase
MIDNETFSVVPVVALESLAQWLEGTTPRPVDSVGAPIKTTTRLVLEDAVAEEAVEVDGRLVGILSKPEHDARAPRSRVGIVMVTTGSTSRSGPGRMHVQLARNWAALGYTVLRFDVGGAGESLFDRAPETWGQPYDLERIDEVGTATRWLLESGGVHDVMLFGVCSGAFNAFHAALDGADARSLVLVNPAIYYLGADQSVEASPDKALSAGYVMQRGLVSRDKWKRALTTREGFSAMTGRMQELVQEKALSGAVHLLRARARHALERWHVLKPKPSMLVNDLDRLVSSGMNVAMIFAADEPGEHYARAVGGDNFERLLLRSNFDVVRIDGGDHIFSPPGARARLAELATEFARRWHPTEP